MLMNFKPYLIYLKLAFGRRIFIRDTIQYATILICKIIGLSEKYYGFSILDTRSRNRDPYDLELLKQSIDVLRKSDPLNYDRVRRYLTTLVLMNKGRPEIGGEYRVLGRMCVIYVDDPGSLYWKTRDLTYVWTIMIGAKLIHEATHGRILTAGISYTENKVFAVESVCKRREVNFILQFENNDTLIEMQKKGFRKAYGRNLKIKRMIKTRKPIKPTIPSEEELRKLCEAG